MRFLKTRCPESTSRDTRLSRDHNRVGGWLSNSQPTSHRTVRTGLVHGSFMPLQTCGSKSNRTGIQPSQAVGLKGLFAMWGWKLSASIPFWNWQEYPHFYWRFPASAGFSILCGLASISSKTPCGSVCASIHRYFGDMFPCLPACSSSPSQLQIFSSLFSILCSRLPFSC